jgi:hypothetical protein
MSKDFADPAPVGREYETKASRQTVYKVTLKVTQRQAEILQAETVIALINRGSRMSPEVRGLYEDLRDTLAQVRRK